MDIIKVENLQKSYGQVEAVKDISFVVKSGELFAFLGLNGAGKSTTINIINGSLIKDAGKVYIDGEDVDANKADVKSRIGIVFQNSVLDRMLTVNDNLTLRAGLYGMTAKEAAARIAELSGLFNLKELLTRKVKTLSGGQRRRADIARALIHRPKILIMDEPTTGLDPQTRSLLWEVVDKLRQEGLTVFLTTHYMEEADGADYVVIIDEGVIASKGTPSALKAAHSKDTVRLYTGRPDQVNAFFASLGLKTLRRTGFIEIEVNGTRQAKELIGRYNEYFDDFEVLKGDMNSVFLNVTGKALRGE